MTVQSFRKAVAPQSGEPQALHADGATRVDLARDDRWPPLKIAAAALIGAAILWAVILIPVVLRAAS